MRSDGALRRSFVGNWVLSLSSVQRPPPLTMAEDAAGAAIVFAGAPDNLPKIVTVENGRPRPVEPGDSPSTTIAPDTFSIIV